MAKKEKQTDEVPEPSDELRERIKTKGERGEAALVEHYKSARTPVASDELVEAIGDCILAAAELADQPGFVPRWSWLFLEKATVVARMMLENRDWQSNLAGAFLTAVLHVNTAAKAIHESNGEAKIVRVPIETIQELRQQGVSAYQQALITGMSQAELAALTPEQAAAPRSIEKVFPPCSGFPVTPPRVSFLLEAGAQLKVEREAEAEDADEPVFRTVSPNQGGYAPVETHQTSLPRHAAVQVIPKEER